MDVRLFLEYLPWLRKPDYYYKSKNGSGGWTEQEITEAIASQALDKTAIKRSSRLNIETAPEVMQLLYAEHSLGNVHMLWTNFWSEPRELLEGWGFADMSEANVILVPSGRVEAYNAHPIQELHGESQLLGVLARDLESYLEAMLYGALNAIHFISGFPDEDPILYEKTVLVAKHCALIAGGYEYYDFWAGILGLPYSETVPE
ncbi:MAG: hypothetical protein RLZZ298_1102 [Pseudomonadota bacterium]